MRSIRYSFMNAEALSIGNCQTLAFQYANANPPAQASSVK